MRSANKAPDGRGLAGATITAVPPDTRITRTRNTDDRGRYGVVFPGRGGRPPAR